MFNISKKKLIRLIILVGVILLISFLLPKIFTCLYQDTGQSYVDLPIANESPVLSHNEETVPSESNSDINSIYPLPESDGITPYIEINGNIPFFSDEDKQRTDPFEDYSDLDELKRCGVAYANICIELMPTEKRGPISSVKPSGWIQASYPGIVEGNNLWNRCHLIGFQLAGENANKKNLITGTRYLNVTGMLVFEDQVASYVKETNNHVLYRVTPLFEDDELVARGVLIEAYSVEDNGELEFCVYCFNIQPGIEINYQTGESWLMEE